MWPAIIVLQDEPKTHYTSIGSDKKFKDFIMIHNGSQGAVAKPVEVYASMNILPQI